MAVELDLNSTPAAIAQAYTDAVGTSNLKVWNGTTWVSAVPYVFKDNGKWERLDPHVSYHNGTAWVP